MERKATNKNTVSTLFEFERGLKGLESNKVNSERNLYRKMIVLYTYIENCILNCMKWTPNTISFL